MTDKDMHATIDSIFKMINLPAPENEIDCLEDFSIRELDVNIKIVVTNNSEDSIEIKNMKLGLYNLDRVDKSEFYEKIENLKKDFDDYFVAMGADIEYNIAWYLLKN